MSAPAPFLPKPGSRITRGYTFRENPIYEVESIGFQKGKASTFAVVLVEPGLSNLRVGMRSTLARRDFFAGYEIVNRPHGSKRPGILPWSIV